MEYIKNSLFFKERYSLEIEEFKKLEEKLKNNFNASSQLPPMGFLKVKDAQKEMLFLNFLMLKIMEELLYKEKATQEVLCFNDNLMLKMHICDDAVIFKDTKYVNGVYITYSDSCFKKNSLSDDILNFIEGIIPDGSARKLLIDNIKNDLAFIEKLKIEEKIEPLLVNSEKKLKRI